MAITTARYGPIRRFLSTESSVKEEESAAGSTESNSQNTSTPSPDKKQPSRQKGKSSGRRNRKDFKLSEDQSSMAAAATVISEESDKKDSSESKSEPPQFPSTITRLVDNHPLSEEDFDPHQFLIHLSEDKLDRAPPTPLFDEETADNLPRSHRITGKDRNGNEVTVIEHLPPKNEERMNQLGFYLSKKDMHGYSHETPMLLHKGPLDHFHGDVTEGMPIDVLDALAEETEDFADLSNETPNKSSDESQNEVENDVPLEQRNDFSRMRLLGDWLEGTAFHPGSDIQLDLELEMLARNAEFRRLRRDSLQFERGYDNRSYSNSTPWIDTHRIEAIDARLHELHQMREAGELDYPIENDAAVEAKRIRREQKIVRNAISHMLGQSRESATSDAYLFSKQTRKSPQQSFPLAAKERDESLDEMEVYAIPVEKLYQARRQELDKLRGTSYEDFDLDYLLAKSGRSFESRGKAASLYELRHGYNEVPRSAIPAGMDARVAGREAMLLDYLEGIAKKSANGIYNGNVRMINEDMEKALEEAEENVELEGKEEDENEEDEAAVDTSSFTPESLHTSETVDHVPDEYTVSEELNSVQRPPSAMKRPLKDIEVGVSPNGNMKVFWRENRQTAPDFSRDKREFFQQVDEMLNKWEGTVSEDEKNYVISSQDMEDSRRNVGQPPDVSSETFHSRYLDSWKNHVNDAKLVTELLGGVSVEQPEKILKELGIDSEDGIEKYLMDTFENHEAPVEQLYPPELLQARDTREKSDRLIEQLKKQLAKRNAASKNDETSKEGGENPSETSRESGENPSETSSETPKEGSEVPKEETSSEPPKEDGETPIENEASDSPKEDEIPLDHFSETPTKPLSFEESFARMYDRFTKDGEAALAEIPDDDSGVIGEGHPVDALEYSDEVYVHEKDRQLIYAMFCRGTSPQEISRSFGFAESRVTAIIRLMADRERHQKEGTFDGRIVDQLEENESPWKYDYRDFPPASYRFDDHRKKATIPAYIPKFVFLKEGEEEEKVMREVESLIRRNNHKKEPVIHRKELKVQEGRNGHEVRHRTAGERAWKTHLQNRFYGSIEGS